MSSLKKKKPNNFIELLLAGAKRYCEDEESKKECKTSDSYSMR